MCNQVLLVGRLVEINEDNILYISVNRNYKNENDEYETDKIKVYVWGKISESTKQYCKVGDIIGIKGRLQEDKINGEMKIVAERVTFLSSIKNNIESSIKNEE